MSNFFGSAANTDGTYEQAGGEPLPENTVVLAALESVGYDTYEGDTTIKCTWVVLKGEYQNRKVFQKIRSEDSDSSKREKALKMLAAIDHNCGGKLVAAGTKPTDLSLQSALANKPMFLKLGLWEMNGKTGNWVKAVAPAKKQTDAAAQQVRRQSPAAVADGFDGDDIPF